MKSFPTSFISRPITELHCLCSQINDDDEVGNGFTQDGLERKSAVKRCVSFLISVFRCDLSV